MLPDLAGNTTGGYGGAWPAYIWHSFMTTIFGSLQATAFPTPDYTGFDLWNQVGNGLPMHEAQEADPDAVGVAPGPTCMPTDSTTPCPTTGMEGPCPPGFSPPPVAAEPRGPHAAAG